MIGIVVSAHAELASALVSAARLVVPSFDEVVAIGVNDIDDSMAYQKKLSEAVQQVDSEQGVLILTDMFGGTPSNLSFSFLKDDRIEIITGFNLPMLIKFVSLQRSNNLKEVAKKVVEQGKKNIHLASALLSSKN